MNVKDMNEMFYNCISLTILPYISKWKINYSTNANRIFNYYDKLKNIPSEFH